MDRIAENLHLPDLYARLKRVDLAGILQRAGDLQNA